MEWVALTDGLQRLNCNIRGNGLRVAYVTQWFSPEPDGPPLWVSQALRGLGFDVHVVTGIPNYPLGVVYRGYSAMRTSRETIYGLRVTRSPIYPSHDQSALHRVMNYMSFALSASWMGRKVLNSADVSLVYSSPETAAIPAVVAEMRHSTPYVLLIQDLWPETVLETGFLNSPMISRTAHETLSRMDKFLCNRAAHILVISPGMKDALVARGVPAEKITVMFNWVDESVVYPQKRTGDFRTRLGISDDDLLFTFAGNHGSAQGLAAWIDAIGQIQDLEDLHFAFIGHGTAKLALMAMAAEAGLQRMHFLDSVPMSEYVYLAADVDAQIVSLSASPLFQITIPGKLQACLALGKAIIGSVAGDAAQVIRDSRAGFLAAPDDRADIERAIRAAHSAGRLGLKAVGDAGRAYYLERMSSEVGSKILGEVLRKAAWTGSGKAR